MADNNYDLNGLYKIFSVSGQETLSLSVFSSLATLVVFRKGSQDRRPVVKFNITGAPAMCLSKLIKDLVASQPDTRMPFFQMNYNREQRTYERATSFVFFKDEKKCYGVEITNNVLSTPAKFMFKAPSTFAMGSEPMTEEQKSELGILEFRKQLDNLCIASLLSRFNMQKPMNRSNGNNNNRNNYNRPPSGDPYKNQPTSSEDVFG